MIKFTHSPENEFNPFGSIRVEYENPYGLAELQKPIDFKVVSYISGKVKWESQLSPGTWSYFGMISNTTSYLERDGKIISEFVWDTFLHGDMAHQYMLMWAMENPGSFGIAVGTFNGETGEWVEPVRKNFLDAVLVEASLPQYNELEENYRHLPNCKFMNSVVTPFGGEVTFWESEDVAYTNSIRKDHVEKFTQNIVPNKRDSISLNDLIESQSKPVEWIHLDVEGIDTDLVMSINPANLTGIKFLIYETLNSTDDEKQLCKKFLTDQGFMVEESGWNTFAIRKFS